MTALDSDTRPTDDAVTSPSLASRRRQSDAAAIHGSALQSPPSGSDAPLEPRRGPAARPGSDQSTRPRAAHVLLALFAPPLAVYLTEHPTADLTADCARGPARALWLNILLTLLGFVPGVLHALWLVSSRSSSSGQDAPAGHTDA